jgi:HYR domain
MATQAHAPAQPSRKRAILTEDLPLSILTAVAGAFVLARFTSVPPIFGAAIAPVLTESVKALVMGWSKRRITLAATLLILLDRCADALAAARYIAERLLGQDVEFPALRGGPLPSGVGAVLRTAALGTTLASLVLTPAELAVGRSFATPDKGTTLLPIDPPPQVDDETAPRFSPLPDLTLQSSGPKVVTFTADARDEVDGKVETACSPSSGSTFAIGTRIVTCSAVDESGNRAVANFKVTIQLVDADAPELVLPPPIEREATSLDGAAIGFSPSARDEIDGRVRVSCSPPPGSTFRLGTTEVTCSAADENGNVANDTFTVRVLDRTQPTIEVQSRVEVEATSPDGAVARYEFSARDTADADVQVTCTPSSGSQLPLGERNASCTAIDDSDNSTRRPFVIAVIDRAGPQIDPPADRKAEATSAVGAAVQFGAASAVDLVDGARRVQCSAASGEMFPLGATTIRCTATDSRGNVGEGSFTVTVVDTTRPRLSPLRPITGTAELQRDGSWGAVARWEASAWDVVSGEIDVTCSPPSGSVFRLTNGETRTWRVRCTATDASGNSARGSFPVTVRASAIDG